MKINLIVFLAALLMTTAVVSSAQPGPPPPIPKEERLAHLKERLDLTKEQTDKVASILASSQKEMERLREKDISERRERMDSMRKVMDEENSKIEKLLSDDQKKSFAEMKKEREKRRRPDDERPDHR